MKNRRPSIRLCLLLIPLLLAATAGAQELTVKEIMKEPSIAGMRAEGERLSPDGRHVVFLWNAGGKEPRDLYLVRTDGGEPPRKLLSPTDLPAKKEEEKEDPLEYGVVVTDEFVKARRDSIGNLRWSPDSSKILFTRSGDIYVLKIGETKPKRVTRTESFEFAADFLDDRRILFQQGGNLFSIDTSDGTLTQISTEANPSRNVSLFGATPSDDGSMIAYVTSDGSDQKPLFVPNYLPLYTLAPTVRRGWTKSTVHATRTDGSLDKAVTVELPKQDGEAYIAGLEWLADNETLLVDRIDETHKRRQIYLVKFKDEKASPYLLHEERDLKWIGGPARILEAHPTDPNLFFYGSEDRTGYMHLWLVEDFGPSPGEGETVKVKTAASMKTLLTDGQWEVSWAKWLKTPAGEKPALVFASTKGDPKQRTVTVIEGIPGSQTRRDLSLGEGMKNDLQLENGTLLYTGSRWNLPGELYAADAVRRAGSSGASFRQLTRTAPEAFLARKWNAPRFIEFDARDGKKVPARVYFPEDFDRSKKYPMVIFVHGAGYLQNVIDGWNNYYREFMFNQLLTRRGYVVLDVDYRGSAGYGRDWRTDVHDFLGGTDYTDHIDGIDHMVREYNIDQNRIGAYGGSYGGFMAAMLVMRAPERIAAAAALRPVMDWKNYYAANPFYTSQRLGDPKKNPEAYKRSSPIAYAKELRRPLLILHGLLDDNVHAQDSIQLVEQLMRLDKTEYFELMLYPAERHGFERPSSWEDEYERILRLFEEELKQ